MNEAYHLQKTFDLLHAMYEEKPENELIKDTLIYLYHYEWKENLKKRCN